jgi:hypothetical protein
MKLSTTLLLVAALAVVAFQADAKGIYRGVGTNAWSGGCADINALSRMSW